MKMGVKSGEIARPYGLGALMYEPFALRLHPFEWGSWQGFDRLSLNGLSGTQGPSKPPPFYLSAWWGFDRLSPNGFSGAQGPSHPPPFALSSSKGCAGFDPPVLGTVEGLSPNGM